MLGHQKRDSMATSHHHGTLLAVSPSTGEMTVSVTDTDTGLQEKKDKKHLIYKVIVEANDHSWFIYRKFTEFASLYDRMKKLFPDAGLKLPAKSKLFGGLDPHFMRHRREALNDFVQKLVNHEGLSSHPDVQGFLNIVPTHRSSTDEDDIENGDQNGRDGGSSSDEDIINLGPSERLAARPGDFEFLNVIGKGSFGKVLLAKHKAENIIYAVKVLNKSHIVRKNEAKHIMSERNVLVKNVKHPFLVGLHYSFQTPDKLYFILDYVNGGELFYHLQRERCFSEGRSKFYAAEMASALGYLHSLNIIYRDLKPENILLDSQGHIVLTDFGLCKEGIVGRGTTSTFCGTPEYLAPEVLRKEPYDKTVDWWCLGSVLYEMMFGLPPFYSKNVNEMYDNILHKALRFRSNVASSSAKNILEGLLQKGKSSRLGAKHDLLELQKHAFFTAINWRLLDERKVKPPYNPNVADKMDLKHFDPEFTREPVPGSVGRSLGDRGISASVQAADAAFMGFSYVGTEAGFNMS